MLKGRYTVRKVGDKSVWVRLQAFDCWMRSLPVSG
jgi:hypothetical protein